jgi:hypothetical protein
MKFSDRAHFFGADIQRIRAVAEASETLRSDGGSRQWKTGRTRNQIPIEIRVVIDYSPLASRIRV